MINFSHDNAKDSTIYNINTIQVPRVAETASTIFIDGTNPSQGWDDCPWVDGSGTYNDPYVIHDLTIHGGGSGSCISITNTWQFFRIENCTLSNTGYPSGCIQITNSKNGFIWNITCNMNYCWGISLSSSDNITVGNTCTTSIVLESSDNNTLVGNTCTGGSTIGIQLLESNDNNVAGNNCTGSSYGICLSYSKNNTVVGNNCTGGNDGICLSYSNNNTLVGNNCMGNNYGIYLSESNDNTVARNNCTGSEVGINLYSSSTNTISNNTCNWNSYFDIYLDSSSSNTIANNTCTGSFNGIGLRWSSSNTIVNNTCTGSEVGINLYSSSTNTISNNTCNGNSYFNIHLDSSHSNTIANNTCTGSDSGIGLSWSSSNTIVNNICTGNAYGIYLEGSQNTQIYRNFAENNERPFMEVDCAGNNIHHNWFWGSPVASFIVRMSTAIMGKGVEFKDTTTGDAPFAYQWSFGDGTENSTVQNPTHAFASPGTYLVILTATDFDGDVSVFHLDIVVQQDWTWLVIGIIVGIIVACVGFAGFTVHRKWPLITRNIRQYKTRITRRYATFKDNFRSQWSKVRKRMAEEQARWAALALQRKVEEEKQRAEILRQRQEAEVRRQEEEARIARQQADLASQRRDAEERRIQASKAQVERVVLELSSLFSKLQVGEIAEKSGVTEETLIIGVIQQMIARKQIDATYFKSTQSVAFQQQVIEKPFPPGLPAETRSNIHVLRQYEYAGGKVRLKVKIINRAKTGLLRITCLLNIPDSFKLLRVEPADYTADGTAVKLQDLLPKEEKTVAFVLEPMICGKEQFSGNISGVDAAGEPFATPIIPLEVEVRCPLFASPEEANLPLLKHMVLDLSVKSERVFYLPETLAPADAFELAKSAISERDVRFVGTVAGEDRQAGDTFDESVWFYGTTKVERKRYVLSAAVSEKDRIIRLATACDDEAGCTGFLAETGAAVRRELVRRGAFESERDVIELVCEKCGATLPRAPTITSDVRCPECQWTWRLADFFR